MPWGLGCLRTWVAGSGGPGSGAADLAGSGEVL